MAKTVPNQNQNKDLITNRVLTIFSLCMVGIFMLMYLNSLLNSINYMVGLTVANVVRIVALLAAVAGGAMWVRESRMKIDTNNKLLRFHHLCVAGVLIFVMMSVIPTYGLSMFPLCYGALIGVGFLFLIFHSYPWEYFIVAANCIVAAGFLAVATSSVLSSFAGIAIVLAAILAAAQSTLIYKMMTNKGELVLFGKEIHHKFPKKAYQMMMVVPIALFALVLVGAFAGTIAAYVAFGVIAALFFGAGVYYTVGMI